MTIHPALPAIAVAIALTFPAAPAVAEVFKCATPAGRVEYRDYACDPNAAAQSIDTRANTIGTGEDLESIRARNDAMTRRLDARRAADERIEREREAREWAYYEERAYRDLPRSNAYADGPVYWPAYVQPHKHRRATPTPPPAKVPPPAIVTRRKS